MPPRKPFAKRSSNLLANRLAETEDFNEFIRSREQGPSLTCAAAASSEPAFAAIWGNPEDSVYDAL
jgi:hypothetical protein